MSRLQKSSTFPWWGTILSAIFAYCLLKYGFPRIPSENESLARLFQMGPMIAPVVTIPLLLLAAKQLYDIPPEQREEENQEED